MIDKDKICDTMSKNNNKKSVWRKLNLAIILQRANVWWKLV